MKRGRPISDETTPERPPLTLSNNGYNKAKWLTTIVLPAIGTLYFAIAQIWGLPSGEEVLGTIIAVQAFLGVLLGVSSNAYKNSDARYDGEINIREDKAQVAFNEHPTTYADKDEVIFKVNSPK